MTSCASCRVRLRPPSSPADWTCCGPLRQQGFSRALIPILSASSGSALESGYHVLGSMSQNDPTRSWVDKNGVPVRPYGKYDADRYVPAGTIKQYDFLIYSRFAFVRPGSKLRFVLTTQAPTDICSPFLGTDPCFPTAPQTASLTGSRITIHHGPSYPSAVNLPLHKAGCWNPSAR